MLQHEEQEELISKILKTFEDDILKTFVLVEKAMDNIALKSGINEQVALNYQYYFNEALTEAGYFDKVNDLIDNKFDELYRLIRVGINEGGYKVRYTQDDLNKILALKKLMQQQFTNLSNETATKLQQNLYKYVLSNASLRDIQTQIKEDLKNTGLVKYSTTYARTSIGEFQQSVIDLKAQDLEGVWVYVGVDDGVTRPFCKALLKKDYYFTDEQKIKLQNDPQRKYNCRHRFRKITLEDAIEDGYAPYNG